MENEQPGKTDKPSGMDDSNSNVPQDVADPITTDAPAQDSSTIESPVAVSVDEPPAESVEASNPPVVVVDGKKRLLARKFVLIVVAAVVLVLATIVYVFGYYTPNRPANVFKSALVNTGKGYDAMIAHFEDEKVAKLFETSEVEGDFKIGTGSFTTDGTFSARTTQTEASITGNVGLGVTRVTIDGIVKDVATSENPDVYLRAKGIKGLGEQLGVGSQTDQLNDQWILIDHTLFDTMTKQVEESMDVSATNSGATTPNQDDIMDAVQAVGTVSKQFIFTDDTSHMTVKMDAFVGKETVDGKATNRYKVKVNKDNLKAYVAALGQALDKSKLNAWAETNYDKSLSKLIDVDSLKDAIGRIDDKKSYDMWVNTKTKLVHKIRFTPDGSKDAAKNYIDLGLNYAGGDDKPFFIRMVSNEDDTAANTELALTMNTKTNVMKIAMNMQATEGDVKNSARVTLQAKPATNKLNITVPASDKVITLAEAMSILGLGGSLLSNDTSTTIDDTCLGIDDELCASLQEDQFTITQ